MFRTMRRFKQQLTEEHCAEVLARNGYGTLAVLGDDGYPYTVPMSYVYADGKFYFHTAVAGHKVDAIRANSKASFCVVDHEEVLPEKLTSYFRSVVAFGQARIVEEEAEKRAAMQMIADRFAPDFQEKGRAAIESKLRIFHIIELTVEHMTGKESMELKAK